MKNRQNGLGRFLRAVLPALGIALAGSLPFLLFREQISALPQYGYLGLLAACFLTNATIFLPAAGIAFTLSAAAVLSPIPCALIGGLGTALGELVGYCFGRAGLRELPRREKLARVYAFLEKWGYAAVFLFALVPLPVFDAVGIAAGRARLSPVWFFLTCLAGKTLKMLAYVLAASALLPMWR